MHQIDDIIMIDFYGSNVLLDLKEGSTVYVWSS